MTDAINPPITNYSPNDAWSPPSEPTPGQTILQNRPLLGLAVASAIGAAIVLGVQASRRRRERRQFDQIYAAASEARGGMSSLGSLATMALMRRPDLLAAVLVELAFLFGRARARRRSMMGRVN
jgi:hypothetical protein